MWLFWASLTVHVNIIHITQFWSKHKPSWKYFRFLIYTLFSFLRFKFHCILKLPECSRLPKALCVKLLLRDWWYVSSRCVMFSPTAAQFQILHREIIAWLGLTRTFRSWAQSWNHSVGISTVHFTLVVRHLPFIFMQLPTKDGRVARCSSQI